MTASTATDGVGVQQRHLRAATLTTLPLVREKQICSEESFAVARILTFLVVITRYLGCGRIAVSKKEEAPILVVNLVQLYEDSGGAVVQSDSRDQTLAAPAGGRDEQHGRRRLAPRPRAPGCPGRTPPCRAVKHPVCPYKTATQNRFAVGNAEGHVNTPGGPGPSSVYRIWQE